jgi:glycerophosphoryl diester phosphodiesterase
MIRMSHFAYDQKHWSSLQELPFQLPELQAHRGYWIDGALQNSLESVLAAQEAGHQMAEVDLRLTKDQKVVLFHDPIIYDGDLALEVSQLNLSEMRKLLPVSTLEEVLEATKNNFHFNLEIKNETRTKFGLEEKLIQIFKSSPHKNRIIFSSFNPFSLGWVGQLLPQVPRGLLVTQDISAPFMLREMLFLGVAKPHFLHVRWEDLDHYRDIPRERKVIWTLNDLSFAKSIQANRRVASIISDQIKPGSLT